ncbi:MAG: hypothetical protein DBY20_03820 [Coriobacteriia bacterium]|nr:MAG: hypothetical protein DBY20_03820 [Coriobacteriia bacterium]
MDYDPSKTAAYLQGRIDEYVKFSARDTIMRNVRNDRHARYARVPDGGACDFCKMLGSRGFVYHSEDKAGGDSFHGTSMDSYHPFCNCQIAVCFDPYVDEYKRNGVTVRRGYGDGEVTVPGRDGSDEIRNVDIDELFEQYKSMTANFGSGSSKYRDYSRAGFLTPEAMDKARKMLEDATTMDELMQADAEIMRMWQPGSHVGRNQSQWDELSTLAGERKKAIEVIQSGKPMYSSTDLDYDTVNASRVAASEAYRTKKEKEIENLGGQVIRPDDAIERHLRRNNAWAVTYGDTAVLPENATRAEIAEEAIHVRQNIDGLNNELDFVKRQAVNEYLAQVELLEIAKREGFSKTEIELTMHNRDMYYADVERLGLEAYVTSIRNTSPWG